MSILPPPNVKIGTYDKLKTRALAPPGVGEDEFDDHVSDVASYGRSEFWDDRYAKSTEPFDWYYEYDDLKGLITSMIPLNAKVLVAGCGTSNMLIGMAIDGYESITGFDISRVAITQQKIKCQDYPSITLLQGNMTDSDLPEHSYDCIIDKALLDSILCSNVGDVAAQQYILEVMRLLNDTGYFICMSHGNPEVRLKILEQLDLDLPNYTPWNTDVLALVKPQQYEEEVLDREDPDSLYFIYVHKIEPELVKKKLIKEKKLAVKAREKRKVPKKKSSNL